ncbi:hypothetical protein AB1Y20_000828 [Prymnesium parvum]|uniref:Tudor domain-containing protein n=1 Tax=Prymnesium parvum TaxID=97485 RepID=A0AB34KB73_PRYPA
MSDDPSVKLQTYRQQLAQVEAAIEADPTNREWTKLKADLLEVIHLTSELAQVKASVPTVRDEELRTYSVGEKCQAIYEQDGQWYNAKIVALSEDGYFVTFLSYGNTAQVEFNEVRPYQRPDTTNWVRGTECTAIHAADSRWYDAVIIEAKAATVIVVFKGETEPVEVDIDFVRIKLTSVERKRKEELVVEAKPTSIPKALEIRPDDSQEAIEKKKRKLNMFKRQEKKQKEEQHSDTRRASWNNFAKKNKTIKSAKNWHDPHWDPTRDHGELAARVQMEKYTTYMSREA